MLELEAGFAGADAELLDVDAALLDEVLSPLALDSAGFDSAFDSPDDSDVAFSELALEEDFGA